LFKYSVIGFDSSVVNASANYKVIKGGQTHHCCTTKKVWNFSSMDFTRSTIDGETQNRRAMLVCITANGTSYGAEGMKIGLHMPRTMNPP
jgi:hypothetical protein